MTKMITVRQAAKSRNAEKARNRSSVVLLSTLSALVAASVWAYNAEIDQISRASGQIIPAGRVQVVQSPDSGQIERIAVREGDRVRQGQLLFALDDVRSRAAVDEGRAKVAAFEAQLARIEAELFDKPLVFPPHLAAFPDLTSSQRALYAQRRFAIRQQAEALGNMRDLAQRELEMNRPLLASGDVSRSEVMRLERQVVDIEAQLANTRNKYLQDLQTEYAKVSEDVVTAREVLKQRQSTLKDTRILAPSDGLIKNVRFTTPGGVLRPGDEMLQVVPTADELIVEAKVSPADIARVQIGQNAAVKFEAYDSSIYGDAEGKVTYISPDTLTEQGSAGAERSYYRVHVRVDLSSMKPKNGVEVKLQPGMTATIEIKTGSNTVLKYLMKPIVKTISESFGEP
ncbi:MAG: HlyD family efflux transporter periplasmic adaptor subunit [Sphingomonadales bacterium]|jgi:adhesin transport system membrane fusion protein